MEDPLRRNSSRKTASRTFLQLSTIFIFIKSWNGNSTVELFRDSNRGCRWRTEDTRGKNERLITAQINDGGGGWNLLIWYFVFQSNPWHIGRRKFSALEADSTIIYWANQANIQEHFDSRNDFQAALYSRTRSFLPDGRHVSATRLQLSAC